MRGEAEIPWTDQREPEGTRWTILRSHVVSLQEIVRDIDLLEDRDDFEIVHRSMVRTIGTIRIQGPEGSERVYVKTYRHRGWGNTLRFFLFGSKAKAEWAMGIRFMALGIPSFQPLAYGERRKGPFLKEAYLVTREVPNSISLDRYLEELRKEDPDRISEKKANILKGIAGLVGEIHRKGIYHRDLHSGNILVKWNGSHGLCLHIIDLHRADVYRRISKQKRLQNLAQLFFSLSGIMVNEDEGAFLAFYAGKAEGLIGDKDQALRTIHRMGERVRFRHFQSRQKRCIRRGTLFDREKKENFRWFWRRGAPIAEIEMILTLPRSGQAHSERVLKSSKETTISICSIKRQAGTQGICLKTYRYRGLIYGITYLFRPSKAMKSWVAAHGLLVRGIPTARPMALIEERRWRVLRDSFLFMEDLTDCPGIDRYVKAAFTGKGRGDRHKRKRALITAFATTMRSLHNSGIFHKDLKAANVLVKETGELSWMFPFIDLDGVSFQKGPIQLSKRILNLIQINASIPLQISSTDRLRFLLVYRSETGLSERGKAFARKVAETVGKVA